METQQTPEHGNGKVAAVLLLTLWGIVPVNIYPAVADIILQI